MNKTAYDLGKGGWYALNDDKQCFQDLEYLINYIITECYSTVFKNNSSLYSDEEKQKLKEYISNRIAPDLFELCKDTWAKDIFIFNDSGDDITICRALGYKFIGHRYDEKSSKEYQEHLDFLNRHLTDPARKRMYDPEEFKQYHEFELYKKSEDEMWIEELTLGLDR
jgi:hypothetical protein